MGMQYIAMIKKFSPLLERYEVELIISHVTKKPREFFLVHDKYTLSFLEYLRFTRAVRKRIKGVPLAYITGKKEFYGLEFEVNTNTLVPRPDTEVMVEAVKLQITNDKVQNITLIDVGTGSGCIPIAIGKYANRQIDKIIATDISKGALRVAKRNAKKHNVDIQFLHGNLLEPLHNQKTREPGNQITIITANLPYLTEQQFIEEPSIQHEPKNALVADDHGLALYKELLLQLKNNFSTGALTGFFEIDPTQTDRLTREILTVFPQATITCLKDLSGTNRCLMFSI